MSLESVLLFAQKTISDRVKAGDAVVDATVGLGSDTLFLARVTGTDGIVFGFDIQPEALAIAQSKMKDRLSTADSASIHWILRSHEFMLAEIPSKYQGKIRAVMFNLGYLPHSDHLIKTQPQTTVKGLDAAVQLLQIGGVVTIIVYTGHEGAQEEADAVLLWASLLAQKQFNVISYRFLNQVNDPPFLIIVEKK